MFMLYAYADTIYYAETSQGLESGALVGMVTGEEVFAWWKPLLFVIDIVVVVLLIVWLASTFRSKKKQRR